MSVLVRLRLQMADAPGTLAQAATIIAEHGGNIIAIDVQQGEDGSAVDEVTVELAETTDLAHLRRRLNETGVTRVVALQSANREDLLVRVLRRLATVLSAPTDDHEVELRRAVSELCATPSVWVSRRQDAAALDAGRQALRLPGEAILVQTNERLPVLTDTVTGEGWLLAVAQPPPSITERVIFVSRSLGRAFTPTEIARVETLIALYSQIESSRELTQALSST